MGEEALSLGGSILLALLICFAFTFVYPRLLLYLHLTLDTEGLILHGKMLFIRPHLYSSDFFFRRKRSSLDGIHTPYLEQIQIHI